MRRTKSNDYEDGLPAGHQLRDATKGIGNMEKHGIDNPGIAACMRLNAKLTERVEHLADALRKIAGAVPCGGAMVEDDEGPLFPPDSAAFLVRVHARNCARCIASAALVENKEELR